MTQNFEDVVEELKSYGFSNIETREIEDLTSSSDLSDGDVGEISINDETNFEKGSKYTEDANVIVTYHTIPKVSLSLTEEQLVADEVEGIIETISNDGFVNIQTEEKYDIDPDETTDPKRELLVGSKSVSLPSQDVYPFDEDVKIVIHYPYAKYNIDVSVDFIANIFFDKYDVDFQIDHKTETTLPHGEDWEGSLRLKEGEHVLTFCSADDSSIKGETKLDVQADTEVEYKIVCYGEEIKVEVSYIDVKTELGENEAKISGDKWVFYGENYKDVEAEIKKLGFTNVTSTPLYDIIWGITETESVDYVTINGSDEYKKGDVFEKDAEVIIPYHMPYEDDPDYQDGESDVSEKEEQQQVEENNSEPTHQESITDSEDYEKLYSYVGKKCFDVTDSIKEFGYTPKYIAAFTFQDMTSQIEWDMEEGYTEGGWIITTLKDIDSNEKIVSYIVTSQYMRDNWDSYGNY